MAEGKIKQSIDGMGTTLTDVPEPLCKPCISENIEFKAQCYCVQCKEWLCDGCRRHHLKLTITKFHTLMGTEDAQRTDASLVVQMGSRVCHIHPDQDVEQFCTGHKVLCCSMCLADDHNSCESEPISTISKGYAQSAELSDLTGKLTSLKRDVDDIIGSKHNNAKIAVERYLNGSKTRAKLVDSIIMRSYIDTKASKVKETIIKCIHSSEKELLNILKDIQHIQVSLDSTTDYEEELFIRAKRETSNLRRFEDFIKSCNEKLPTPWILSFSPDYETILSKYVSLKPTTTTTLRVKQPMESKCSITDIECLSDGRYVLVDSSNKALKLFRRNNQYQSTHCLQMRPFNVVEMEPGRIAVTIPEEKIIRFVSVTDTLTDECSVQVDDTPNGLATFGGKMFVSFMTYLRILGRDGNTIERISKGENGEDLFVNLTCIMINNKTGRFYAVDEGRLAFVHVYSIRQMKTKEMSTVLFSQDKQFKPSMTFDEDDSLYVCTPESIRHFNPDLVELQTFEYKEFYTSIRLQDSPSADTLATTAAASTTFGQGTVMTFAFGTPTQTGMFSTTPGFNRTTTAPDQFVVVFPKYAIACHKSIGQLFVGGESDCLSVVHIG